MEKKRASIASSSKIGSSNETSRSARSCRCRAPFRSTVQLPFPEKGASVTGISSPTFDGWVPHPGNLGRTHDCHIWGIDLRTGERLAAIPERFDPIHAPNNRGARFVDTTHDHSALDFDSCRVHRRRGVDGERPGAATSARARRYRERSRRRGNRGRDDRDPRCRRRHECQRCVSTLDS